MKNQTINKVKTKIMNQMNKNNKKFKKSLKQYLHRVIIHQKYQALN